MKKLFIISAAAIALASCSNDDVFTGETNVGEETGAPITFSSASKGFSRAGDFAGAEAADKLGNMFVVEGWKGQKTAYDASNSSVVYDNYLVNYLENSAETTESNSSNWEYVGVSPIKHATDNGILKQTIKFWDYTQPQYDFIAWSAGKVTPIYEGTPSAGKVLVSAVDYTGRDTCAFTMTGAADDLSQCYIADLVTVKKNDYQKPVTFSFRSLGTKVRIALYETVPGYSVKNVEFYSAALSNDASAASAKIFTTEENAIFTNGTYTVYYPTVDNGTPASDLNKAHVKFSSSEAQKTTIDWGALNYTMAEAGEKSTSPIYLGRTSSTASYAGNEADNYYVAYIPNEEGTNLNLRVNYTLESIDGSGEVIKVQGASAQVPYIYTTWKPGYAYTYIFKISDKTNGTTGQYDPEHPEAYLESDPAGLYPITFDAFVEDAEDGDIQETITTVSAPSFTTYAKGSNVVNKNEYAISDAPIFVTINQKDTLVTLTTDNVALYKVSDTKATEALVNNIMTKQDPDLSTDTKIVGRNKVELTKAEFNLTNTIDCGADGNNIILDKKQAARFVPATTGTYALVYTFDAPDDTIVKYEVKKFEVNDAVKGYYYYGFVNAPEGDVKRGETYFELNTETNVYKKCEDIFLGQKVNNCYLDVHGTTAAKGNAVTGTDYYYTVDGGKNYKKAHNVNYADIATVMPNLFELNTETGEYSLTGDAEPVDGTAYYYKDTDNKYYWCVFLPQQTTGLSVITKDQTKIVTCGATEKAHADYIYLDKYTVNNGVYYSKVIKIQ